MALTGKINSTLARGDKEVHCFDWIRTACGDKWTSSDIAGMC